MFERVEQFAALRLFARDGGTVERQVADLFRRERALHDHAVHQGADRAVGPTGLFAEFLLDGGGGARFVRPDRLDDRPLSFRKFNDWFGHG